MHRELIQECVWRMQGFVDLNARNLILSETDRGVF